MNAWARTLVLAGSILVAGFLAARPIGAPIAPPDPEPSPSARPGGPPNILGSTTREIEVNGPNGPFRVKARVAPDGRITIDAADNPGAIK